MSLRPSSTTVYWLLRQVAPGCTAGGYSRVSNPFYSLIHGLLCSCHWSATGQAIRSCCVSDNLPFILFARGSPQLSHTQTEEHFFNMPEAFHMWTKNFKEQVESKRMCTLKENMFLFCCSVLGYISWSGNNNKHVLNSNTQLPALLQTESHEVLLRLALSLSRVPGAE